MTIQNVMNNVNLIKMLLSQHGVKVNSFSEKIVSLSNLFSKDSKLISDIDICEMKSIMTFLASVAMFSKNRAVVDNFNNLRKIIDLYINDLEDNFSGRNNDGEWNDYGCCDCGIEEHCGGCDCCYYDDDFDYEDY